MDKRPFVLRLPDDLVARVDDWRVKRRPIPSKAEAIRQLVERALDDSKRVESGKPIHADTEADTASIAR